MWESHLFPVFTQRPPGTRIEKEITAEVITPPVHILNATEDCEQPPLTDLEEQTLIGHDISRLPPRVFRQLPAAVAALRKERS